jgi:hypothetical protein
MKKVIFLLLLSLPALVYGQMSNYYNGTQGHYDVMTFNNDGSIGAMRIRTKIPFSSDEITTVYIKGYLDNEKAENLNIQISWRVMKGKFEDLVASNSGSYLPEDISLTEIDGYIQIFIVGPIMYRPRFELTAYSDGYGTDPAWFTDWEVYDESANGNDKTSANKINRFWNVFSNNGTFNSLTGNDANFYSGNISYLSTNNFNVSGSTNLNGTVSVAGQSKFSRDNYNPYTSNYTIALSENTASSGKKSTIAFHNAGQDEASMELSRDAGFRSIRFYDHQGQNLGIDVTGYAKLGSKVRIGTGDFSGNYALAVEGIIGARRVKITQVTGWPDYVFHKDYKPISLTELERFIQQNKHLPDVPSAEEAEREGIDLSSNQAILLKKIEELTLYIIDMNKKLTDQQQEIEKLKSGLQKGK